MKIVLFLFLLMPNLAYAFGTGGGGGAAPVIPCTASSPSQASSFGISNLVFCDTFANNIHVDVNNTQQPGYTMYPAPPYTAYVTTPPQYITTDGTGMQIAGAAGTFGDISSGKAMQTIGRKATSPYYVGTAISGSYYAEIEMKFDPVQPGQQQVGNAPAWWSNDYIHYIRATQPVTPFPSSYVELDMLECLSGTPGGTCVMNTQFHHWIWNDGTKSGSVDCNSNNVWPSPGPTVSDYNKYGVLVVISSDNGGTGLVKYYINDVPYGQCTYTASGQPVCSNGLDHVCAAGALSELDTQQTTIMLGTGYYPWPITVRNFHVWQKS